jgi:hypothetical protein
MSNINGDIIRVELERDNDGLYVATSPDLAGVCIAHRDVWAIHDDFPTIVALWFKTQRGQEVDVFNGPLPDDIVDQDELNNVDWRAIVLPSIAQISINQ